MSDELAYDRSPRPAPANAFAIVSVIAGLLLCIPGTGLVSIPTGLIGMRRAKRIAGVGAVPARIGLVLGIINVFWWSALLVGALSQIRTLKLSRPAIENQRTFIRAVSTGNISDAKSLCTDAIDEGRLTDTFEQIRKWGLIESVDANWGGKYHGASDIEVTAEIKFEQFSKLMTGHWMTAEKGPMLTAYEFRDPPTTQAATPAATEPTTQPK